MARRCPKCWGTGQQVKILKDGTTVKVTCRKCKGSGWVR